MPAPLEPRPVRNFRLKLGGHEAASHWQSVSGLDFELGVFEHKTVDEQGKEYLRKIPGSAKFSDITLKRGIDPSLDVYQWAQKIMEQGPEGQRVDATFEAIGFNNDVVAVYSIKQCWPKKYTAAALDATKDDAAVEELILVHEGFERKQ